MFREPPFQIRGCADVFLIEKIDAADDVDVPHERVARRARRGGARRDRTADLLHAMQALSQLSYGPLTGAMV